MVRKRRRTRKKKAAPRVNGDWHKLFIEALAEHANVKDACEAAGIPRRTAYDHKEADEAFSKAWDEALEQACDVLVKEARRRALKMSDTLLIFLLKCHRPSVYGDRQRWEFAGTGKNGESITAKVVVMRDKDH